MKNLVYITGKNLLANCWAWNWNSPTLATLQWKNGFGHYKADEHSNGLLNTPMKRSLDVIKNRCFNFPGNNKTESSRLNLCIRQESLECSLRLLENVFWLSAMSTERGFIGIISFLKRKRRNCSSSTLGPRREKRILSVVLT